MTGHVGHAITFDVNLVSSNNSADNQRAIQLKKIAHLRIS